MPFNKISVWERTFEAIDTTFHFLLSIASVLSKYSHGLKIYCEKIIILCKHGLGLLVDKVQRLKMWNVGQSLPTVQHSK